MAETNLLTAVEIEQKMDALQLKIAEHRRLFEKFGLDSAREWNALEAELAALRQDLQRFIDPHASHLVDSA